MTGFFRIALPILALMLVGIGVVALAVENPRVVPGWEDIEDEVIEGETESMAEAMIPPLDAAAQTRTELATFALG